MKVLLLSNLDSQQPFGQFTRPFYLGRGIAAEGIEVASVGVDCSAIDYGPVWSAGAKSLVPLAREATRAIRAFEPDLIYAQELRPGLAALATRRGRTLVADFHSLPSLEWAGYAAGASGRERLAYLVASRRSWIVERLLARRADAVIASGAELAEDLMARHRPRRPPAVVVNGVDAPMLAERTGGRSPFPDDGNAHAVTTLPPVFPSNVRALEFLATVGKALARRGDAVALHVLGAESGPTAPGVSYEGFQPDLAPWIEHADACLLPYPPEAALAGGPRNKLLEYLARGRTLVSTREGLRGLREVASWDGVHVVADDAEAFAAGIVAAAAPGAPTLDASRDIVRERLQWDALGRAVAAELRRVMAEAR